ncbi:alpha/beta hydrolase [Aureimonas sp. SA4125]|uniref:alpha/beta fold hydrolase n=1 Tax=Aureimonas sp. SA4125 TaxID=2826993 RepID=UPI001CC5869E|nr:alpha/beta hydrolase [Aureimonas sp. SA4125]BDA84425.1 alpha/beta hydrolase [Aureimonas sp. SA4125]
MTDRHFVRDGLALRYRDVGTGLPLLFQHGLGGDAAQVADVMPTSPLLRRITLECRGQGGSPFGPTTGFSIAGFADDVAALADERAIGRAVVGGISMGAAIALRLAVRRPETVRAVILARPAWVTQRAPENMRPYGLVGDLLQRFEPEEARLRFMESEIAETLARLAPDNLSSLAGFFARAEPKTFGALLSAIAADGPGVTEAEIAAIDRPVLVIGHGQDLAHPEAMAEKLAGLIPGAELVRITPKAVDRDAYRRDFQSALQAFLGRLT